MFPSKQSWSLLDFYVGPPSDKRPQLNSSGALSVFLQQIFNWLLDGVLEIKLKVLNILVSTATELHL